MKNHADFKNDFYHFLVGFFMGCANVIPGVSGGTMLFIMGAFDKLINAIRELISPANLRLLLKFRCKEWAQKVDLRFLLFLFIGIGASFATLTKVIVYLLGYHKLPTYAFFLGLVAASIYSVARQIKKWSVTVFISMMISAAAAFGIISLVPINPGDAWYITLGCGAVCIIAMILPGLSGSFLMLIFGQYDRVWNAVGNLTRFNTNREELAMLGFLVLGAGAGLGAFVHLLTFLLKRYYNVTMAALIGFMVGSLPRLWPFQHDDPAHIIIKKGKATATRIIYDPPEFSRSGALYWLCILSGIALVLLVEFIAHKKQQQKEI